MGLFGKFEINGKIVKNHGLTPLLFDEIFRSQKFSQILVYNPSNKRKRTLFGLNFYILGLFGKFEIGRKIVKNHGLTPLLFGKIFPAEKLSSILV